MLIIYQFPFVDSSFVVSMNFFQIILQELATKLICILAAPLQGHPYPHRFLCVWSQKTTGSQFTEFSFRIS